MLIGKGHDVTIFDEDVTLARVYGSNRTYIDQTIPHISRLMRSSLDDAVANAEVVVVAKRSPVVEQWLTQANHGPHIIDLVRAMPQGHAQNGQRYEGICW